jgi:FixJ family two-component response regulator
MTATPLVYVVDDDEPMRASLLRLLEAAGYETRAYGSTGEFLLDPLPDRSGCLLLDVRLPGPSGLDLQAALQRQGVALPVIFLTGYSNVASCVQAMKAGAIDFLEKPIEPKALLAAIASALARENSFRTARNEERISRDRLNSLSARERQIFDLVIAGKLNKEIAYELAISERTVKKDRSDMMAKLGAVSIAGLARKAEQLRHALGEDKPLSVGSRGAPL